ncbi:MAG: hypothetical protein ACYTBJ_01970 [Planctomycetota bacterium]|jgi:hypothetical protein
MARLSGKTTLWTSVAVCTVLLGGLCFLPTTKAKSAERGAEDAAGKAAEAYRDSRIFVEAFVVEVRLKALYKLGVSPIGQKPNAVSIKNIVECLKSEADAKVTAGTKVAVRHNEKGSIKENETKHIQRERQVKRRGQEVTTEKVFEDYSTGMTFTADAIGMPEDKIQVTYGFDQSCIIFSDKQMPPDRVNRQWNGRVSLEAGKPSIVGSTQNSDMAVFLILSADIENQ